MALGAGKARIALPEHRVGEVAVDPLLEQVLRVRLA
jgi:hypothetical protein